MTKYYVTLEETVHYDVEVEAEDETSAELLAIETWNHSSAPMEEFNGSRKGVEAINCEEADEEDAAS